MKLLPFPLAASLAFLLATAAHADKLVIKGSDTLGAKLVPQLAEAYKAAHPDTDFEIAAEGSTTGLTAIIDGTADIGMSSRKAKITEVSAASAKGVTMKAIVVAYDGLAVVVNSANPVQGLTKKQIQQIFTGDITDWSAVGGQPGKISIYTRNTSSGTYSDFKELAMKKRDYAAGSQKMAGNEQIAAEVGRNPQGIGYIGLAYLKAQGIKEVAIDGALATPESIRSEAYPYARPTYFYTNGEPTGAAKAFIEFALGPEGQKISQQVGFVPLK